MEQWFFKLCSAYRREETMLNRTLDPTGLCPKHILQSNTFLFCILGLCVYIFLVVKEGFQF